MRVLLVDDDPTFRLAMAKALARKGLTVRELSGGAAAIGALLSEDCPYEVVVLDLQMPQVSGMEVLRRTPRRRPQVVVLTGHGTIPDAVLAMLLGAFSFLLKPIDADELLPVLEQAAAPRSSQELLIGESAATRGLRALLDRLAEADDPVLLCGETGTGKEVAARYLHQRARRAAHPFLAVNLACMPTDLLESELFGHARGAFTGAERKKQGLFGEAGDGVLFLDEVSELPLLHQPKLLRAIEARSYRAVGETREEPLRARLVLASNRDLRGMVQRGEFREDLFYRLAVLPVVLPPLRERPEDIVPIAEHWLRKLTAGPAALSGSAATPSYAGLSTGPVGLSPDARVAFLSHDYPGNVRELVNVVRRIALFARAGAPGPWATNDRVADGELVRRMLALDPFRTLRPDLPKALSAPIQHPTRQEVQKDLPPGLAVATSALIGCAAKTEIQEPLSLRELEIRHIERLLREHKNITMVAKLLDIDRRTLQRKLRALGIDWRDDL